MIFFPLMPRCSNCQRIALDVCDITQLNVLAEELQNIVKYPRKTANRTCCGAVLPGGASYMTVSMNLALQNTSLLAKAVGHWSLARCISGSSTVCLPDGQVFTKQKLYLEALRHDPTMATAYFNLGAGLEPEQTVTLVDGRTLCEQECYVEALRYQPNLGDAYYNLAMFDVPIVLLADGRELTRRQLFVETLRCCPTHADALTWLASTMGDKESITLAGQDVSRLELHVQAILLDPSCINMMPWCDRIACTWLPRRHRAFGDATNLAVGCLLLCILRMESKGVVVRMDAAVLEEMLGCLTLYDVENCSRTQI